MLQFIPVIGRVLDKVIDGVIPDKNEAARIKLQARELVETTHLRELEAVSKIIIAEATSEGWLARNWRPVTMLTFVGLVVSWWLGFTPERATPELMEHLFELIKIGLGGYVVGRSAEKVARVWRNPDAK